MADHLQPLRYDWSPAHMASAQGNTTKRGRGPGVPAPITAGAGYQTLHCTWQPEQTPKKCLICSVAACNKWRVARREPLITHGQAILAFTGHR